MTKKEDFLASCDKKKPFELAIYSICSMISEDFFGKETFRISGKNLHVGLKRVEIQQIYPLQVYTVIFYPGDRTFSILNKVRAFDIARCIMLN